MSEISGGIQGGSSILRAVGTLQAYTGPATAAQMQITDLPWDSDYTLVFTGSLPVTFAIALADPGGGVVFIDRSAFTHLDDVLTALEAPLAAAGYANVSLPAHAGGTPSFIQFDTGGVTGSGATIAIAGPGTYPLGVVTHGADPTGDTHEVVLAAGVTGKHVKMISGGFDGAISGGVNVGLYLRSPGNVDTQITTLDTADHCAAFARVAGALAAWSGGLDTGERLVAKLSGGTLPVDSSTCMVEAEFEQS